MKLIGPVHFGTKSPSLVSKSFLIRHWKLLESELSFVSEDSKINFDRARSTTVNFTA